LLTSSLADCGDENVPYPFLCQMAKVEAEKEPQKVPWPL
jgi:hypothetical protein